MNRRGTIIILCAVTLITIKIFDSLHLSHSQLSRTIISNAVIEKNERRNASEKAWKEIHPNEPLQTSLFALEYYTYPRKFDNDVPLNIGRQHTFQAMQYEYHQASMAKKLYANEWTSIGPANYAGRMRAVAYDPTNSNIVYAGAASGGVWKSIDGGVTWSPISDFLPSLAVAALAVDKNNPNRIFAGTGEGSKNWDAVFGDGLFLSEDGGMSWRNILTVIPNYDQVVNAIALHPVKSDTLFAAISFMTGNSGGLFKTIDKGQTWQNVRSGFARDVVIDPNNPSRIFAALGYDGGGGGNGIYRSDTYGNRFSFNLLVNGLPPADSIGRIRLAASPSKPNTFIAVIVRASKYVSAQAEDLLGIYRTTNGGDNWERMPCSDDADVKKFMATSQAQGFYNLYVAFHPTDSDLIFIGGINNWRSRNFGLTFQKISSANAITDPVHVDQHAIAFDPNDPSTMLIGNDGGMYRTRDNKALNVNWEVCNTNLVTFQFYAMEYDKLVPTRVFGGTQDNGTNRGNVGNKNWVHILTGDGGYVAVDPSNSNIVYAEMQFANIRKSVNGGNSFSDIKNGINYTPSPHFVAPFIIHPSNPSMLFLGSNMVYRTTNGGMSWVSVSPDLTNSTYWNSQITHIALSKSDPNVAFAVTGNGRCWKSVNASASPIVVEWTRVGNGSGQLPGLSLTQAAIDPTDPKRIYVATSSFDSTRNGVYMTPDGGQSWQRKVPLGSDGKFLWRYGPCNAIAISPKNPYVIFVGTDVGVFITTDRGDTWSPFGKGLPVVVVDDIRVTETDVIYASTHGRGMWMASTILGINDYHPTPNSYALEQNYPNPFTQFTTIKLPLLLGEGRVEDSPKRGEVLSRRGDVSFKVYDSFGREVLDLSDKIINNSLLTIHNYQLPSNGIYFYRLTIRNESQTKMMVKY